MNIYLIQPPVTGKKRYGKYSEVGSYLPPLGVCSLAGVLLQDGHKVKIIDGIIEDLTFEAIYSRITEFNTDIVGVTATSLFYEQAALLAGYIKQRNRKIITVLGGVHITVFKSAALTDSFDYGIYGEGEASFRKFVNMLENKSSRFNEIDGLIYRDKGSIKVNFPAALIENLDTIPHPPLHLLSKLYDYKITALTYRRLPMITIISSRGCPFRCMFCSNIMFGQKYRFNSSEYVLEEIDILVNKYGFREIMFYEDNFPVNKERLFEICEGIIKRKYDLIWACSSHINNISREKLDIMKKAGCWLISVGVESAEDRILRLIRKSYNKEHLIEMLNYADKIGIAIRGFFILGHPTETKESLIKTIDFACSLPFYTINLCLMSLFPGSEFRECAHKYGQVNYDLSLVTGHPFSNKLSFVPDGFTEEELIGYQRKGYRRFYLRPSQVWRILKKFESVHDLARCYKLFKTFLKV